MNRLKIISDDDYHVYPLNDVHTVVFSHIKTTITIPLLSLLVENNINVLICNSSNDPIGMFQPFNAHSLVFRKLNLQINWKITRKKKLWKKIVQQKIQSEIDVLKLIEYEDKIINVLRNYKDNVVNDDSTNKEAVAARFYFKLMFGPGFNRDKEDVINAALNYGYKIIASFISRSIASRGYVTQLGIHHIGEANPFNLTYDFIEPLRVIIDYYVVKNITTVFTTYHKREIVMLLEKKVYVSGKYLRLTDAIEDIIDSYFALLNEEDDKLLFIDVSKGFKEDDEIR